MARAKTRCLIVTGDPYCRAILVALMEAEGYGVDHCASLKDFVVHGCGAGAEVIFFDDRLDDMTPYEALRMMRAAPPVTDEPPRGAVLLTGSATRPVIEEARLAGFNAVIPKPVSPALVTRIMRVFRLNSSRVMLASAG